MDSPAPRPSHDVTLVTATYGRRWHLLQQVLDAAFAQGVAEAIVVDNGAGDDIGTLAPARHPGRVHVVAMGSNTGSAPAFHAGIARAAGGSRRFVLLLDDDNRLEEGALDRLLAAYEQAKRADAQRALVVVGFRPANQFEIAAGATHRVLARDAFVGFDVKQLPARAWRRIARRWLTPRRRPLPALAMLDVAPYGGMLFDKALVDEIGLPNPEFVLYADDTEYSYRVTRRSGRLLLVTAARVVDVETSWNLRPAQGSAMAKWLTGGTDLSTYYALRNRVYFETHHVPHAAGWRALNRWCFLSALRWVSRRLDAAQRLALLLQAVRDGEAQRLGVKPGLELR